MEGRSRNYLLSFGYGAPDQFNRCGHMGDSPWMDDSRRIYLTSRLSCSHATQRPCHFLLTSASELLDTPEMRQAGDIKPLSEFRKMHCIIHTYYITLCVRVFKIKYLVRHFDCNVVFTIQVNDSDSLLLQTKSVSRYH